MHLLSGYILSRNASNFTHSHLDYKSFPGEEPQTSTYRGREGEGYAKGLRGSYGPTSKGRAGRERTGGREGWERKRRGRRGLVAGESCSKVLGG